MIVIPMKKLLVEKGWALAERASIWRLENLQEQQMTKLGVDGAFGRTLRLLNEWQHGTQMAANLVCLFVFYREANLSPHSHRF